MTSTTSSSAAVVEEKATKKRKEATPTEDKPKKARSASKSKPKKRKAEEGKLALGVNEKLRISRKQFLTADRYTDLLANKSLVVSESAAQASAESDLTDELDKINKLSDTDFFADNGVLALDQSSVSVVKSKHGQRFLVCNLGIYQLHVMTTIQPRRITAQVLSNMIATRQASILVEKRPSIKPAVAERVLAVMNKLEFGDFSHKTPTGQVVNRQHKSFAADDVSPYIYGGKGQVHSLITPLATRLMDLSARAGGPSVVALRNAFNYVLLNKYPNSSSSLASHSDDGVFVRYQDYPIVSLSFGATRTFRFDGKGPDDESEVADLIDELVLESGSSVVMWPPCQEVLNHRINPVTGATISAVAALPKDHARHLPRYNITMRVHTTKSEIKDELKREDALLEEYAAGSAKTVAASKKGSKTVANVTSGRHQKPDCVVNRICIWTRVHPKTGVVVRIYLGVSAKCVC
jgi:alkylated DNA repair dioxygenase AlkB